MGRKFSDAQDSYPMPEGFTPSNGEHGDFAILSAQESNNYRRTGLDDRRLDHADTDVTDTPGGARYFRP